MFDFKVDEIISKLDSPLLKKASEMEKETDANVLDYPIAKCVDIKIKEGKFADNPTISGVSSWIREVNPNYDPFDTESAYNVNCGACAYVVYERLNGNDAVCASANNVPTELEMEKLINKKFVPMSPQDIENRLMTMGDGAHAIIGVVREYGSGHWFNEACLDGKVVAIDGQSGEILEWPPDYGNVIRWEMSV